MPLKRDEPVKLLRLIIGLDPASGGPTESSVAACLATQHGGIENTFAFTTGDAHGHPASGTVTMLEQAGVALRPFRYWRLLGDRAYRWGLSPRLSLWVLCQARRYDMIHVHGAWGIPSFVGLVAGRVVGKPVIVSPHEALTRFDLDRGQTRTRRLFKRFMHRVYFTFAKAVVFSSQLEMRDSTPRRTRADTVVIPHPIELPAPVRRVSARRGVRPTFNVGFLGRLHPKKNVGLLIQALERLPAGIRLTIAGAGDAEYASTLHALASESGVADRVDWLGFVPASRRSAFLYGIDVLALPSQYECFGMAAAEALAHGVPVAVSPQTGIAELVRRYDCGWVVSPTSDELARLFMRIVGQPDARARAGHAGRTACEANLTGLAFGLRMGSVYEAVCGRDNHGGQYGSARATRR